MATVVSLWFCNRVIFSYLVLLLVLSLLSLLFLLIFKFIDKATLPHGALCSPECDVMVVPCLLSSRGMLHSFSSRTTLINAMGTFEDGEDFKMLNNSKSTSTGFPRLLCLTLDKCSLTYHAGSVVTSTEATAWPPCMCLCVTHGQCSRPLPDSKRTRRSVFSNEIIIFGYPVWVALWFSAKRNWEGEKSRWISSTFNLIGVTFLPPLWYFNSPICLIVA